MKILITLEDTGTDSMKIVAVPSFEKLMQMRKDGKATPVVEAAIFALIKIRDACMNFKNKKQSNLLLPPGSEN